MRGLVCCAILLVICALVQAEDDCGSLSKKMNICGRFKCENGRISAVGCPTRACKEQIGYREEDRSKPYPECCGGPICKGD